MSAVVDDVCNGAKDSFLTASFPMVMPACDDANTDAVVNSSVEIVTTDLMIFTMILSGRKHGNFANHTGRVVTCDQTSKIK